MRHRLVPLIFLSCVVVVPVLSGQLRSNTDEGGDKKSESSSSGLPAPYKIQPNDVLEIFVWKETDLTRKQVLVRPDGRISFPLIQDMPAAGLSPAELKEQIEQKLKEFLDAPNVTVIVEAIQSYRVFVTGKVAKGGAVTVEKPVTVLQAVALAGGFMEFANLSEITIISSDGSKNTVVKFNYSDVIKGKNLDQNIFLKSGDVVNVP